MALWRDPLDDLIADLESTIPVTPVTQVTATDWQATFVGCQIYLGAVFSEEPGALARVQDDPRVKAFLAQIARLAQISSATSPG